MRPLVDDISIPYVFSGSPNPAAVGAALGSCKIHRAAELGQRPPEERLNPQVGAQLNVGLADVEQGISSGARRGEPLSAGTF